MQLIDAAMYRARSHDRLRMPEISRFLGIVIAIFYRDHAPPHFHAYYGEYEISVDILDGHVAGQFPRRALRHVEEWREIQQQALLEDWQLASENRPLNGIRPLE